MDDIQLPKSAKRWKLENVVRYAHKSIAAKHRSDNERALDTSIQPILLTFLERIASGKDGVQGTADDILSSETLDVLRSLVASRTLEEFVERVLTEAALPFIRRILLKVFRCMASPK
jgi:hypothetical protein